MPFKWNGVLIQAQVAELAKKAIDKTMADCVTEAKTNHPYKNITGTAEGSVRIVDFAEAQPDGSVEGRWGSVDVVYFLYLELGTSRMPAFPSLRPAADKMYPNLKRYMREGSVTLR